MAGITANETFGGIAKSMWTEAGIQFRSNLLQSGQRVDLHQHNYDHVMLVTRGVVSIREIRRDGTERHFTMPSAEMGYRVSMPAFHRHEITCIQGLAEVLCFWPAAASGADHEGC